MTNTDNFNNIYNSQNFEEILKMHPNLKGLSCENNTLFYTINNDSISCPLNTFKISDIVPAVYEMNKNDFFEFVNINVAISNLFLDKDLFLIKQDIESSLNTNDANKIQIFINNYNNIKKYANYYVGNSDSYYKICSQIINNIIDNPNHPAHNIIASSFKDNIPERIIDGALNEYRQSKGYIKELKPNANKKAGYINLILILYIVMNITILMIISLFK